MIGRVYFISDGERVKIGYSHDPEKRFIGLQTGHALKLALLGSIPGNRDLERDLHRRFADWRVVGEWFRADAALIGAIEDMLINPPAIPARRDRTRARIIEQELAERFQSFLKARHPQNTATQAASIIGVSDQTVAKWFERNSLPNAEGLIRCLIGYGPAFLTVILDPLPDWAANLIRQARREEILFEMRALMAELRDLDADRARPPPRGPPHDATPADGDHAPAHQDGPQIRD